jgi:hypothetical protein
VKWDDSLAKLVLVDLLCVVGVVVQASREGSVDVTGLCPPPRTSRPLRQDLVRTNSGRPGHARGTVTIMPTKRQFTTDDTTSA